MRRRTAEQALLLPLSYAYFRYMLFSYAPPPLCCCRRHMIRCYAAYAFAHADALLIIAIDAAITSPALPPYAPLPLYTLIYYAITPDYLIRYIRHIDTFSRHCRRYAFIIDITCHDTLASILKALPDTLPAAADDSTLTLLLPPC